MTPANAERALDANVSPGNGGGAIAQTRPDLIQFKKVAKVYQAADGRPVRAVDTVTETIREVEFISILGPSGCG